MTLQAWLASDEATNTISAVALVLAVVGAFIAYRSFTQSADGSANAHMHGLFRDYLRIRFDYENEANKTGGRREQLVSFKLYVLEEMHAWVIRERRKVTWWFSPPFRKKDRDDRTDSLNAWEKTILFHVCENWGEAEVNFWNNSDCYGVRFLELIAERSGMADDRFKTWVRQQRANVNAGLDRYHLLPDTRVFRRGARPPAAARAGEAAGLTGPSGRGA